MSERKPAQESPALVHALSVDVEDWHNAAELLTTGRVRPPTEAVVRLTHLLFDLLAEHAVQATWFFLGEVAEAYPGLVRMVVDAGHEVGVHGFHHHRVHELAPEAHHRSIQRARTLIEDVAGCPVLGYRAVAMSIGPGTWYALDAAARAGFTYDSSLFPFRGPVYGAPGTPVEPHWRLTESGRWIFEVPLTVLEVGSLRLPCCGGGYLRHFPLHYTELMLRALAHQQRPAVFYLHPYELDSDPHAAHPPAGMRFAQRLRFAKLRHFQYRNRSHTLSKLDSLLGRHRFAPIAEVFDIAQRRPPTSRV